MISKAQLKDAVQAGHKTGRGTKTILRNFVNKLLLALYPISYLATHTLSGKEPPGSNSSKSKETICETADGPTKKSMKAKKVKDPLPPDDVAAILGINYFYLHNLL